MNILFLSPDFPLPTESGLRVRVLSQLRLLSSIDRVKRIDLLSLSASAVSTDRVRELEQAVPKLHVAQPTLRPTSIRRSLTALSRFVYRRLRHCEPYLVAINSSPELQRVIVQHLASRRYDVVYVGYLGMMSYVDIARELAPRAKVVLEQHNLEWQIFARLAKDVRQPLRQLVQLEANALRAYERQALRRVDSVIAISKLDATEFRQLAHVEPIAVPPFIVPKPPRLESTKEVHLGYIGHLAWQPNVFGLNWFCKEVWPIVRTHLPDAKLTIAGPGLSRDAQGMLRVPVEWQSPGIQVVGFVDELEAFYRSILIAIAPVVGGSGVRMKLLETMSAGIPTVTTADGAAGLNLVSGDHVMIAEDPSRFADLVVQLLSDHQLRARIRLGGYAYLHSEHSAEVTVERLKQALGF